MPGKDRDNLMYDLLHIRDVMETPFSAMFHELGEPPQILVPQSPRPRVVHRVMSQLTYVRRGAGLAVLAGDQIPIKAGDLMILAAGCEHAFASFEGELELLHWHWPQALLHEDRYIVADEQAFGPFPG
jgi:mannose-6-phosphate isomerase-like protein (cupin superfamily)